MKLSGTTKLSATAVMLWCYVTNTGVFKKEDFSHIWFYTTQIFQESGIWKEKQNPATIFGFSYLDLSGT